MIFTIAKGIKNVAKSAALLQAMAGPKAWLKIAAGIAIAIATTKVIDETFEDVNETVADTSQVTADVAKKIDGLGESVAGIRPEIEALAADVDELTEAQKTWAKLQEEGAKIFDETRTPAERFASRIERLKFLLSEGAIDLDVYNRAVAMAKETLDGAKESADSFGRAAAQGPRAIEAGSEEAGRFVAEARFNADRVKGGELVDVNRAQLDELKQIKTKVGEGDRQEVVAF